MKRKGMCFRWVQKSAGKSKRVRGRQEVKEIHEVKEWKAGGQTGRLGGRTLRARRSR